MAICNILEVSLLNFVLEIQKYVDNEQELSCHLINRPVYNSITSRIKGQCAATVHQSGKSPTKAWQKQEPYCFPPPFQTNIYCEYMINAYMCNHVYNIRVSQTGHVRIEGSGQVVVVCRLNWRPGCEESAPVETNRHCTIY